MRALMTGFTPKSYTGIVPPESRGIKDLSTTLPHALRAIGYEVFYLKDVPESDIAPQDTVFVKLWDLFDVRYNVANELLAKLTQCNLNKVILVSDHHDVRPALKSLEKVATRGYIAKKLLYQYHRGKVMENRFRHSGSKINHFDPSVFIMPDFKLKLPLIPTDFPNWILGSLTYTMTEGELPCSRPVIQVDTMTSMELARTIMLNRLYIMPEHSHVAFDWWRPNYLMGIMNGAAAYASPRDQLGLFNNVFTPRFIENNLEVVAREQRSQLMDKIVTEHAFLEQLDNYLLGLK